MSGFANMQVMLSEGVRQCIARGEVTQQQIEENTAAFLKHMMNRAAAGAAYDASAAQLLEMKDGGLIDPQAVIAYDDGVRGRRVLPLLHCLMRPFWIDDNDPDMKLLRWVVDNNPFDVPDDAGVPAFHRAYHTTRHVVWDLMVQKPEFDIERRYPLKHSGYSPTTAIQNGVAVSRPAIKEGIFEATLLEHECLEAMRETRAVRVHQPDYKAEGKTYKLMRLRPLVTPEYLDWVEFSGDVKQEWATMWSGFRLAIEQGNRAEVLRLLDAKIVQCGFSLRHGPQMCRKEFWGEFWTQGRAAVLSLPDEAQRRLANEMMVMLQDALPPTPVQSWTDKMAHEAQGESAERARR